MTWQEKDQALERNFEFRDFKEAFSFLTKVAMVAEKQNHHPEIHNVYNRITLRLSTHDAGGAITQQDRELAEAIDQL